MADRDPFDGETGLKDDFDGVVAEASFQQDPTRNGGNVYLMLTVHADDGDVVEQNYSCGPEWASYDGGLTVQHPKDTNDRKKAFNVRSKVQKLVEAARDTTKAAGSEVLYERHNAGGGMGPRRADLWTGLKFHWEIESEDYSFKNAAGEEVKGTTNVCLPVKFLGVGDVANPTSTPSANGSASPSLSDAMLGQLKALAKAKSDYGAWVDAAMAIDGAVDDQAVMTKIADEAFYKELANA